MMYDELIKALRLCALFDADCKTCPRYSQGVCYDKIKSEAADAIEELKKKLYFQDITTAQIVNMYMPFFIPKWIPVTERLPEKDQTVLAYCAEDNFCYISRMHQSFEDYDVTHWIPLPQMPKDGEA